MHDFILQFSQNRLTLLVNLAFFSYLTGEFQIWTWNIAELALRKMMFCLFAKSFGKTQYANAFKKCFKPEVMIFLSNQNFSLFKFDQNHLIWVKIQIVKNLISWKKFNIIFIFLELKKKFSLQLFNFYFLKFEQIWLNFQFWRILTSKKFELKAWIHWSKLFSSNLMKFKIIVGIWKL